MQTQTQVPPQVPPALEMLMSMGAQPTAPGPMGQPIPTVAMQKAEQQGLPQMAMAAGQAAPSVMRNMEMQKIQQMLQQALQAQQQQQSPGIAGLPAPNMQRMADGGVVGYSGEGPSFVQNLSDAEIERLTPEQRKAYYKELLSRRNAPMPTPPTPSTPTVSPKAGLGIAGAMARKLGPLGLLAELFTTSDEDIAVLERAEAARKAAAAPAAAPQTPPPIPAQPVIGNAPPMSPEAQAMARRQLPTVPRAEAPTRTSASPAAAAPAAPTGIAAAMPAAMTPEEAMASARAGLGVPGTADLRAAIMEAKQAREQMPATGQAGLAALQQQMDAVKRMEEERKRSMASERVIAQLLGRASEGLGGGARADVRFMAGQRAAEDAFYERNVALAAKQDAINDANAARSVGNKEKYVEAMQKLSDAERAIAQSEATYAAAILQNAASVRGQDVQAREGAANRANAMELERMRRATAGMPGETERIEAQFNRLKAQDPAAAEEYLKRIERIRGLGRGVTERQDVNELKALIASLRDQADPMKNMDKASREQASALLRQAQEKLAQMSGLGGSSASTQLPAAALSQLKEGLVTTFANGQKWTLQNGQPTQVK